MSQTKRVYPSGGFPSKWLSYLLLFLSAVVLLSGLALPKGEDQIEIAVTPTATPIPTDEVFDETPNSRELTPPARSWYALQLGAFENEDAAKATCERFQARGAAGYVWQDERYRALAAVYDDRDDAQSVRRQLLDRHTVETHLFEIALPAVRLRVSGMKGQLDILEAAFVHAGDLVAQLQSLGVMMDRQEKNASEAKELITALRDQMEMVCLRLRQRFPPPAHHTVEGLCLCFEDYVAFAGALNDTDSAVELAARVKYQTIKSLYLLKSVYDGLIDT